MNFKRMSLESRANIEEINYVRRPPVKHTTSQLRHEDRLIPTLRAKCLTMLAEESAAIVDLSGLDEITGIYLLREIVLRRKLTYRLANIFIHSFPDSTISEELNNLNLFAAIPHHMNDKSWVTAYYRRHSSNPGNWEGTNHPKLTIAPIFESRPWLNLSASNCHVLFIENRWLFLFRALHRLAWLEKIGAWVIRSHQRNVTTVVYENQAKGK